MPLVSPWASSALSWNWLAGWYAGWAGAFPESLQSVSTEPCCVSEDPCASSALCASQCPALCPECLWTSTELGPSLCTEQARVT